MDILCSLGLSCCTGFVDYTKEVGNLISWQEAISIGGIIFAASQFMEAVKIRNYIYRFGWLYTAIPILVGISIVSVIIANFIQLTGTDIPLLSYPAFYELISLAALSILLLLFVTFFLRPHFFLSLNLTLFNRLSRELLYNQTDENLAALSRIISNYLEDIVKTATKAKRKFYRREDEEISEESRRALQFIDVDMSTPSFVKYIANNNIGFILHFIDLAQKYELWEAGGSIFVDRLTEALFSDEESLLTKELMFGGISGLQKPITNSLFRADGLLSRYRVLNINGFWSSEISQTTLRNWTHALETALKHYYSEERNIYYSGTPNDTLGYSLERLGECAQSIVNKFNKQNKGDGWENEYGSKLSVIASFFDKIVHVLVVDDPDENKPVFSEQELKVEEHTVAEGLAKGIFAYLEALSYMEDEEYARMEALRLYWLLFDGHNAPILKGLRAKVLEQIKERVEQNLKGGYASMIKLMLVIFDGALRETRERGNEIESYMGELFRKEITKKLLKNNDFREKHMPKHWFLSKNGKEIHRTIHDRDELIYPFKGKK